jgi:peptidoglycan/LPS O-acetylase OafA/YrhL
MSQDVAFPTATLELAARAPAAAGLERRIIGLDGLRGVACLMVILSHYFGELRHGVRALMGGWVAVDIFFVLSGFLIGKLILEKQGCANFFTVFYVRRVCRIIPAYLITVAGVLYLLKRLPSGWSEAGVHFPGWSYLAFLQGFWMVATRSIGAHWLSPTWTLAVEEHFYLIVPAAIVLTPRSRLVPVLLAAALGAIAMRIAASFGGTHAAMAALALLPGRADLLICGLLAAILNGWDGAPWARLMFWLRITPIIALTLTGLSRAISEQMFNIAGPALIGVGCAALILGIVRGAPEARRFQSRTLRFFGDNGYCLYLTHLPVLGLMHGLILASPPDLARPVQWLVTLAALPVCVLVGWGMTRLVEEPITAYGRRWRWSAARRPARPA